MDRRDLIPALEQRFLPALRIAEAALNADFPTAQAAAWSQPHGQMTSTPGHIIGLSCSFPEAPLDQPDQVTLHLCFGDAWGPSPTVAADVLWSYPGGVEADLFPDPAPLTEQALRYVEESLPRLIEALRVAVQRRRPQA